VPGITYTNIVTVYDEIVVPYTLGFVQRPNVTSIVVQDGCGPDYSDHVAIAAVHGPLVPCSLPSTRATRLRPGASCSAVHRVVRGIGPHRRIPATALDALFAEGKTSAETNPAAPSL
jgi:hypothetical protein